MSGGNPRKAHGVLGSPPNPLYEWHGASVNKFAAMASDDARRGEEQSAKMVEAYTLEMNGVGFTAVA